MNSYNDNLHAEIVTSLSNQEIELKKLKGQFDASMLSLYYAQGSYITADEKLRIANDGYESQKDVLSQAIIDSDVSTNVLQSVTNANKLVGNAVSNTAVAAANVQIAANAIVKLASDVGAIYSIVNAADFGAEIYEEAIEAHNLMNETAYLAESTSLKAMEASTSIAEVATASLSTEAAATDAGVKNVLNAVTTDFDSAKELVTTGNHALQNASKVEKGAEGNFENVNAIYDASEISCQLSNRELNLDLNVSETKDKTSEDYQYTVSFNPFTSAFNSPAIGTKPYPVEAYYIFLVKDAAKMVFSMATAESIISVDTDCTYIKIDATSSATPYSKTIPIDELQDVNGNSFQLGESYVVFVYAALSVAYKKKINVFDDYLTAPSFPFSITNHLTPAYNVTVDLSSALSKIPTEQIVHFNVATTLPSKVAYRCIFLPDDKMFTKGLLTIDELKSIENKNEKPGFCFDLMIAEMIPAGSYTTIENIKASKDTDDVTSDCLTDTLLQGSLVISNAMTDNFGNRLIKGNTYTPVIISISDDVESVNKAITNTLSDFKNTSSFTYKG